MKGYIASLRAASDEENLRHEEAKTQRHHADSRVMCDKPLTEQIEEFWAGLSQVQRSRSFTMEEMCARLKGRFSARPHPMNVGQALRALGWTQKRDWTHDGGGKRYWYPS